MLPIKPLVIFDFDGTIADSIPQALEMYNELAKEFRLQSISQEEFVLLQSESINAIIKKLGISWLRMPALIKRGRELMGQKLDLITPCRGMSQIIQFLNDNDQHYGVLTSNSVENVERFFSRHEMPLPAFIDSVSRLRNKSTYIKTRRRQYEGRPLIYVGDEVRDIEAARKARISSVAVDWGFNTREKLKKADPTEMVSNAEQLRLAIIRIAASFSTTF
ncbi:MAG: HAD hydrolase-like protein [Gammaproteobacteria bacterium]|nr:HAD hydrolase-like protein [Gammaproteobacteria bacterium]